MLGTAGDTGRAGRPYFDSSQAASALVMNFSGSASNFSFEASLLKK